MKNTTTVQLIAGCLLSAGLSFAQDLTKYETIYYQDAQPLELEGDGNGVTIEIKNIVSQKDNAKFALKIINDGKDIIVYDPSKSTFSTFTAGETHPNEKEMIVTPGKNKSKTINVSGATGDMRQEAVAYETGGFFRVPIEGTTAEAEDYQLPPSKNSFTIGNFDVVMKGYKATTAEARAQFEVTYNGDGIGLINASNLSVRANRKKTDEEVIYANDDKKADVEMLRKGDKTKFNAVFHIEGRIVDMQFATMYIIWNDTFVESEMQPLESTTIKMNWDPGLTNGKNK